MNPIKSYSAWKKYRETCVELGRLSDRGLSDIGTTRREIRAFARRAS